MPITTAGVRFEDATNGIYHYGDDGGDPATTGTGSLTVDGSDTANLTASDLGAGESQGMEIGTGTGANGTVILTGMGSAILFNNGGNGGPANLRTPEAS